ncbi:non-heme iron oxygenase ferredoxin subunit [methanotrophic endosymbiont of Bathymodiolus puteoserpentis (Logatchev)]|jgi:3-phenylpropionate/trans-cinnamate dioxygenase ferredoxin subunit|uniref:non-heme iron oxygenase ferredoxin subunit n=1 Tax=methanotrophic endosymbiont of Bathymodiolus puteoserpentis (Logatchev) TaxID=343235 RepID=UPI0013CC51CF|nr:non-heme iron oxygenase ferredoxin subunit [methanotrophic endosymbiont of Bathymodiolus puteoserpentis (Logatchev)]SHE22305.1 Ferredoxin, 2Fe-2S [methanotrophic endosymbiont of Bathymodiolus puteoserpentis (Logatchev)]
MSEWVDVVAESALAIGEHLVVDVDGIDVAVFKLEDGFYALEDVCTHDGAEIGSGAVDGDEIVCPRHGARFCIKTGQVKSAPAYEDIASLEVRVKAGRVEVKDSRWD